MPRKDNPMMKVADFIPATQAKRFVGLYYVTKKPQYTGGVNGERKELYRLEKCQAVKSGELCGQAWDRTPKYHCWIVPPEFNDIASKWPKWDDVLGYKAIDSDVLTELLMQTNQEPTR